MAPHLAVALFGPSRVTLDGRDVTAFGYDKVRALLFYLVVEADRAHRRDILAATLWPDAPQSSARNYLRRALAVLRQTITDQDAQPQFLLSTYATIQFNRLSDYTLDVASFTTLLAPCPQHVDPGMACATCAPRLQQAVDLYRGDFLEDGFRQEGAALTEWVVIWREELRRHVLGVLARLTTYYDQTEDVLAAEQTARRHLALDPWNEAAHRSLMRVLASAGQRSLALHQYARCRHVLEHDLGIAPEAETVALYEQLRAAEAPSLVALAARRVGSSAGRSVRSASVPAPAFAPPVALPVPSTSLIGRTTEVATVCALAQQPDVRLLTITGPGGVGKTRLALHVATQLQDSFRDGVAFVALAPISDPALVGPAIAQTLGPLRPGVMPLEEALQAYLREQHLLLVLDNFEQVLPAGPLVAALLGACPALSVLVTSRAPLHLSGEHEFPLAPLALPDARAHPSLAHVERVAAVQLFVERARAVKPSFSMTTSTAPAVVAICCRLDGLPLAIELAAARSKLLAPDGLLRRLDNRLALLIGGARDLHARHHTLRATIDWSYDLLDSAEQQLFARLAVFVGGWTLEAAEAVCSLQVTGDRGQENREAADSALFPVPYHLSPLDGLQALLDNHLLQADPAAHGEMRFTMLETIREYALERLDATGVAHTLRQQHAAFYLSLAEMVEALLQGPEQRIWLQRLEEEHDNLRAALAWSHSAQGSTETAVRLAGALWWFWCLHGHFSEARRWLEAALQRTSDATVWRSSRIMVARAKVLLAAGEIANWDGAYRQANALFEAGLALYRTLEDPVGIGWALLLQGGTARTQADAVRARALMEESLLHFQQQRNTWGIAWAHLSLGEAAFDQGDVATASAQIEAARALLHALGDSDGAAFTLLNLGRIARLQGDAARATMLLEESLAQFRDQGNQIGSAQVCLELGRVARLQGDVTRATRLVQESLVLQCELGGKLGVSECLAAMAGAIGAMDQKLVPTGRGARQAARLFGAAAAIRDRVGAPLLPTARADYDRDVAAVRAQLDDASWTTAWAEGQAMPLQAAIVYAQAGDVEIGA